MDLKKKGSSGSDKEKEKEPVQLYRRKIKDEKNHYLFRRSRYPALHGLIFKHSACSIVLENLWWQGFQLKELRTDYTAKPYIVHWPH